MLSKCHLQITVLANILQLLITSDIIPAYLFNGGGARSKLQSKLDTVLVLTVVWLIYDCGFPPIVVPCLNTIIKECRPVKIPNKLLFFCFVIPTSPELFITAQCKQLNF